MTAKKKTGGKGRWIAAKSAVSQVRLCDAVISAFKNGLTEGQVIEAFMAGWQDRSTQRLRIKVTP